MLMHYKRLPNRNLYTDCHTYVMKNLCHLWIPTVYLKQTNMEILLDRAVTDGQVVRAGVSVT